MFISGTCLPNGLPGWAGAPQLKASGMGCADCGGTCGQKPGMAGLSMDGSGLFGTGVFGTGVDVTNVSTWGIGEYGAAAVGLWSILTLFTSGRKQAQNVGRRVRRVRRTATA